MKNILSVDFAERMVKVKDPSKIVADNIIILSCNFSEIMSLEMCM